MSEESSADRNVEIWKIKKLIKSLEMARGNGTSMISLIIPPKDQISRVSKMLADEFGTASNIKSRVNRLSVLGAITSVQHRLKLYTKVPPNGLVIYCGTIVTEEGKEKKVNIDFEPFKPINTSLYLCDNKFHTEALTALLADDNKFGFIVMDGNGALFGTLQGNTREVSLRFFFYNLSARTFMKTLELVECQPLLEWLANNYKSFGATLEIITDKSQEGSQFVRGFGGIGGLLRYKVDFQSMQLDDEEIDNLYDVDDY
nr:eukaryotic peptide chain release factor subunit 1 [Vanessa tameamea]